LTGTPVAGLILVHPVVQIKPVKGDALLPDANFHQIRPDLGIEAVPVHAQIEGGVPQSDQSWCDRTGLLHARGYCIGLLCSGDNTRGYSLNTKKSARAVTGFQRLDDAGRLFLALYKWRPVAAWRKSLLLAAVFHAR